MKPYAIELASSTLLLLIKATICLFALKLMRTAYRSYASPLRDLPGPTSKSLLFGNLKEVHGADGVCLQETWIEQHGSTFRYKGWMNQDTLFTTDLVALNYILNKPMNYSKPEVTKFYLMQTLGSGIIFAEGEEHRLQRRVMNPAFGIRQIRDLTGIFVEKAQELRSLWLDCFLESEQPIQVDVLCGLGKASLDIIGLTGFNYEFKSLKQGSVSTELYDAFQVIFGSASAGPSIWTMLAFVIRPLRLVPTRRRRKIGAARSTMLRIGRELLAEKKADIRQATISTRGIDQRHSTSGRDLLTLLIKANMSEEIPVHQRLSDIDVLAQVSTFFVAGHETTSTATAYCLFEMTQKLEVQTKLREELWSVTTDTPTMDELQALPFLDAVVREALRIHAPVASTYRVSIQEDVIPLSVPYVDSRGNLHHSISISEGTTIHIPILALNRSKSLWGDDAAEFRPERWISLPDAVNSIPGVWANLMTFLGGPRACIAWRFSVVETKALLFTLVRAFEFNLAVPPNMIVKHAAFVQRPLVRGEESKGGQMPMILSRHIRL